MKHVLAIFCGLLLLVISITFVGAITEVHLGLVLAVAIALHNIPEGIAVAVPIYACT